MKTLKNGLRVLNQKEGDRIARKENKKITERKQEHKLALWCMQQAKAKQDGNLTKDQLSKLKKMKFPFEMYLKMYKEYYGV